MRSIGLGDDQKPRRILVEAVHDSGPPDPADSRQAGSAMSDQRVDQRASRVARSRMDDEPGRLVDHDQMLVLVNHRELDVLADKGRFLRRRRLEGYARPRREPRRGIARDAVADSHFSRLDQRLEPPARQSVSSCRRRLAQEPIEPPARVLGADVEDLLTFGRYKWSEGRRIDRDVFWLDVVGLGRMTPGALLRL